MKIIIVDNYDREGVADVLVAEKVDPYWGEKMVDTMNYNRTDYDDKYFKLVKDNYDLWRGMEELV